MPKPSFRFIWSFDSESFTNQEGPKLIGANGTGPLVGKLFGSAVGGDIEPDIAKYTYVNVSRDFPWTLNNERDEVPRVILKEMQQNSSALLTRGKYYLTQPFTTVSTLVGASNDLLDSYTGLYETSDTGFYYDLPNLKGEYMTTGTNSFGDEQKKLGDLIKGGANAVGTMLGGSDTKAGSIAGGVSNAMGAATELGSGVIDLLGKGTEQFMGGAGYFTEQPQFYQHGRNNRTYDVTFPLFNTGSYDDMIRNFQLAYMLVYQNLPNRNDKQMVKPPCIYEVSVPGISYTPYAFMQSVNVNFVGSRREITIHLPFESLDNFKPVRVTIPEAYDIKLSLTELVGNTRNFMFHNIKRKVSTGVDSLDTGLEGSGVGEENEGVIDSFLNWFD